MKKTKKCLVCNVTRPVIEFKRKGKTYKSCNRCSQYKKSYAQSKKLVEPSRILNKIFRCGETLSPRFHQQYKHINKLQKELINDIHKYLKNMSINNKNGSESDPGYEP